jgi:hypothetical protein
LENKNFIKILKEADYIKFQKEINEMMVNFSRKINFNEIKELVKNNDSTNQIIETIKKYIAYYIFLVIGFFYTEKEDKYINNIVEFSKNQANYNYKIENFFNSESNALLIKYNSMIHNILTLLSADQSKINKIKNRPDFREIILFLNSLGADFVEDKFRLDKLKNNINVQAHNIIKTLIIKLIYGNNDKRDFFKILEMSEITDGEYMFINIVIPIKKTIDFSTIENVLGNTPNARHLALSIWKYFMEYEESLTKPPMNYDEKILEMINSGIVVPISDDFLLYHKDSEKYDRLEDIEKIKKKEDTKIKYIINKIDKVRELYSDGVKHDEKSKTEIKKLFYVPLFNRKAILVNIKEDINIINKFINTGKQNIENIDFFKDLEQYKLYPYINFNEFENYGFSLSMTKTVNIVRSVSFSKTGDFKQPVQHSIIQTRIGSKDMIVNIVGFMIPSTNTPLQCIKIKNVGDIRDLDKNNNNKKNGLEATIKYLKDTGMNLEENTKSKVWFFNEELDTFELRSYEQISKFSMQDKIKHMVSELYDKIQEQVHNAILNSLSSDNNLTLQRGYSIIEDYKENVIDITKHSNVYTEVENKLYNLIVSITPEYDQNEDKVYDITGEKESKKISIKKDTHGISTLKINLSSIDEYGEIVKKEMISGICQHNISKEKIDSIDIKDFIKYSDQLYKFIQQYVTVNIYNEYICKSCGYSLDINQYIEDGEYDDETRSFVSYSTPIDISLEDVIGYEKFKIAIRQIDKIIEKIAVVSNLLHLAKGTIDVRPKRKLIVKNTIDLLLANNKRIGKIYKDRKANINKLYGINPNNTELWMFELENNIFVFSSRDIDKYKPLKINNIIAYSIFFILLEINKSHVQFMGDDKKKICNFTMFDRIMDSLFGGLKIIVNNKGDIGNITNYKILCYMIYIISCTITSQTKMWHFKFPEGENKKKFVPMIQRSLIHTVIDVINSVLEIGKDEPDHPLYGMNTSRFFKKLQDIYQDDELYLKLKKDTMSSSTTERKDAILLHQGYVKLSGKYTPITFSLPERRLCNAATLLMDILPLKYMKYYGISNLSNCPDGRYHEWITEKKQMICKLCGAISSETDYNKDISNDIRKKFKGILNRELAENICEIDGLPHIFEISESGEEICNKCGKNKDYKYTFEESEKVKIIVEKNNKKKGENTIELEHSITEKSKKEQDYIEGVIKKLSDEFKKENKDKDMSFMYKLTDEIQKVIGKELSSVNLTENMYIIDHDHLGNPLSNSIKIIESQGKMEEKLNHPYFKTDVLFYSNKQKKIDVFYDAHTKILLGYKEESKNYVLNKKHDRTIKLIYSLINRLKLIGYKSQFIEIDDLYTDLTSGRDVMPEDILNQEIIKSVIKNRLLQLKKVLLYLKIVLSRIINNHNEENSPDDYYKVKINALVEQYSKKRMNPIMSDSNGNNIVFKHWKAVTNGIIGDSLDDIKLNFDFSEKKTIYYNKINEIDNAGNMLSYYIIRELIKLFEFNEKNKILTTTISHFIVDFFNTMFDIVNEEKEKENIDVKRFKYILESSTNVKEIEEKSSIKILEGIVTEYVDSDEKSKEEVETEENERIDNIEEKDALDVDVDPDDAAEDGDESGIDYDHGARGYEGDI